MREPRSTILAVTVCVGSALLLGTCGGERRVADRITNLCGNGAIDDGETCDPPASCPTACDATNDCDIATLEGSADSCTARCVTIAQTVCQNNDACCPDGCTEDLDDDCATTTCGAVTDCINGDTCCPGSCTFASDTDCTPAGCDSVATCANGDGCCPDACNHTSDNDCAAPACDGVTECVNSDGCCPSSCTRASDVDCPPDSCDTVTACQNNDECCPATCAYETDDDCTPENCPSVTACTNGDGCCPDTCHPKNDNNCEPACGNTLVEAGETCDPPATCPTVCPNTDPCITKQLTGSAAACTATCAVVAEITACKNGDSCCPQGCTSAQDNDCAACDSVSDCVHGDGCCPASCTRDQDNDCSVNCLDPASWPAVWATLEEQLRDEINKRRAEGQTCGSTTYDPQPQAVVSEAVLQRVSRCHSLQLSVDRPDTPRPVTSETVSSTGYTGSRYAMFLYYGRENPTDVAAGLFASEQNCKYLMGDLGGDTPVTYDHIGVGYVHEPGWNRPYVSMWSIVLGDY